MTTAAQRPPLTLIKDTAPEPVEGVVVEHRGDQVDKVDTRPTWMQSGTAVAERVGRHAIDNRLYLGWSVSGYRRLGRRWIDARRDYHPQLIRTAEAALRAAGGDVAAEAKSKEVVDARRAEYNRHKRIHWLKTGGWAGAVTIGGAAGAAFGGIWIDLLMGISAYAVGAYHGRPGQPTAAMPVRTPVDARDAGAVQEPPPALSEETLVQEPQFDAAPPPALSEETLRQALRDVGITGRLQVLAAPAWGSDGTATTVFDLPSGVTAAALQKKIEAFAGALGRDVSMIDVTKAGAAGRVSLWMTDTDPFEAPRPSPLLGMSGAIDAWRDGVPVAWNKRGAQVRLPVMNSNFLIGGMTRSGKGVGAANLVAGAALDVRVNLRLVAGKNNGEWDAYAKAGVAATYFKPNAERLLALLHAELADKNRREADLGKLGKSKLVPEAITKVGGIELLVIDELATYTRPGKPLREEILEALIELSAVSTGAGILMVLITQYPEVDVIPQALAMNCGTRWAMRVDNATQSNAILGGSASSGGRDASKFDPPMPGLGWLVNPFAGVTDKARSFDLDEDERGEITQLMRRAADLRKAAGRLAGQWDDPIEQHLLNATGLSSAAGGPRGNGEPGRAILHLTSEQRQHLDAARGALAAMDALGRAEAQLDEMAEIISGSMTAERLGELLRAAGAGGTVKITVPHKTGRVNGYKRADIADALKFLAGA